LESATRLTLLEALSAAADEITRDLAPGSVEVRLRGRNPDFIVTSPTHQQTSEETPKTSLRSALAGALEVTMGVRPPAPEVAPEPEESGGTARLTLRLPEHLKPRIDDAAGRMGLSVNAWLVLAVTAALEPDDRGRSGQQLGRRYTGWVR
jgi:hypothetical protein